MDSLYRKFTKFAEAVAAALLAALFLTFLYQVVARYLFPSTPSWTVELCLALWVWITFWGSTFTVTDNDHVTFDMVYNAVRPSTRRLFGLIGAGAVAVALLGSLSPTLEFLNFLKIKKSATLPVSMREVFSIYGLFLLATGISYGVRFMRILKSHPPAENAGTPEADA